MDKTEFLTILVSITLLLTLVNITATVNLYNKLDQGEELDKVPAPTPSAREPPKVLVSADDDPVKGSSDAAVTIIEFSDFQCPYCEKFYTQTLPQIEKNYIQTGKVKFIYRDYPLSFHQYARKAAEAAECAEEQGKYWEYHNIIYENQNSLDNDSLKQYAENLGLDAIEFNTCLDSGEMASEVGKDFQDGNRYGVTGTPTFFINGIKVVGAQPYNVFQQVIEQELKLD